MCVVVSGGATVSRPYDGVLGSKIRAMSVYGGIANTLQTPINNALVVSKSLRNFTSHWLGQRLKKGKGQSMVIGLCSALYVSGFLKQCAAHSIHELGRALYDSNLDGLALVQQLHLTAKDELSEHPFVEEICNPDNSKGLFGKLEHRVHFASDTVSPTQRFAVNS